MALREHLESVIEEVKRLRDEEVDGIYLQDETLVGLRALVEKTAGERKAILEDAAEKVSAETFFEKVAPKEKPSVEVKKTEDPVDDSIGAPPEITLPEGDKQTRWNWLREKVLGCEECQSHVKAGKKVVFGVGSLDAKIFFCGEAPGAEEETQGEPFVGPAGQLLTRIIQATGLQRKDVYIGNIMNWRPEMPTPYGNRPPTQQEMNYCLPYLKAQLEIVKPEVVVALGATAVKGLLGEEGKQPMRSLRGQWFEFESTPLMVTYHPSYLLHNNTLRSKRMVWEDMLAVMEKLGMAISEKQRSYFLK